MKLKMTVNFEKLNNKLTIFTHRCKLNFVKAINCGRPFIWYSNQNVKI